MTYFSSEIGYLKIETKWVEHGFGDSYAELVGVEWEGPPMTFIEERQIRFLTEGVSDQDAEMIQIGTYVLRRTAERLDYARGYYWVRVGQGEWYWLRWRIRQGLDRFAGRLILTLAVWGLANWPEPSRPARWTDVVKRWRE